jgi:hypothetical protein
MVPSLALTALMSLFFPRAAPLLTILRSIIEARAIHNYVSLLLDRLGGFENAVVSVMELHTEPKKFLATPPLCCCLKPCCIAIPMSRLLISRCRLFALQAVYCIPILSYILLFVELERAADTSAVYYDTVVVILQVLEVATVMLAFWGMMILFFASKDLLMQYNPGRKMLAIKLVLFVGVVQSIVISISIDKGNQNDDDILYDRQYRITAWTSFLLCLESAPLALLMRWSYPLRELEFDSLTRSKNDTYGTMEITM